MVVSLYDAVVPSNLQIVSALENVLKKAQAFCEERGVPRAELIDARLAPDMLPLGYQIKSCAVHSIGGIEGARAGSFSPDVSAWLTDLAGLHGGLQRANAELSALDRDVVDALIEADTHFAFGETKLPFTAPTSCSRFLSPTSTFTRQQRTRFSERRA